MPMAPHQVPHQMKHVPKRQKPSPPVRITMYLAQHALHAIPVIHTVMVAVSAMRIAMNPKRTLVPSYCVHNPKTVNLIPVARAILERVTGGITSLQPIHPAHQMIVISRLNRTRAKSELLIFMPIAIRRGVKNAQTNPTTVITPAPHRPIRVRGNVTMGII